MEENSDFTKFSFWMVHCAVVPVDTEEGYSLTLGNSLSLSWYLSLSLSFRRSGHISCGHCAIDTEEGDMQGSWQGAGQNVELRLRGEEGQKVEGKEIN